MRTFLLLLLTATTATVPAAHSVGAAVSASLAPAPQVVTVTGSTHQPTPTEPVDTVDTPAVPTPADSPAVTEQPAVTPTPTVSTSPTEASVVGEVGEAVTATPDRCLLAYEGLEKDLGGYTPECREQQLAAISIIDNPDSAVSYSYTIGRNEDGTFTLTVNGYVVDTDATNPDEALTIYTEIEQGARR